MLRDDGAWYLFDVRHSNADVADGKAPAERALANDRLTEPDEHQVLGWAEEHGITARDWSEKFRDLIDRMLIARVNDGRLPDVTAQGPPVILKEAETAHYIVAASLMKEIAHRQLRGGGSGVSFRIAKGVRFHTGAFRARYVVVRTSLEEADRGNLTITSLRTVYSGQRKTLDLPHSKLVNLNVYTDGISFNLSNRQTVPLFKVPNGQVVAAIVNAAAQRVGSKTLP